MLWFRSHHGAAFDSKLAVVAKRANVTRGHAASVWWAVLDYASQQTPRGFITGIDPEELAAAFDYDQADVEKVIGAMKLKSLLIDEEGKLTGWDKRQVQREDGGATTRKRNQRSRDKEHPSRTVTQSPAPEKRREEEIREEKKELVVVAPATPAPFHVVGRRVLELMGVKDDPRWLGDYSRVDAWLREGFDAEKDIYPTVQRLMAEKTDGPPNTLKYFEQAIGRAHHERMTDIPKIFQRQANGKRANDPIVQAGREVAAMFQTQADGELRDGSDGV